MISKGDAWKRLKNESPKMASLLTSFNSEMGSYRIASIRGKNWEYIDQRENAAVRKLVGSKL